MHLNRDSLEATTRLIHQGAKTEAPTQQSATQQQAYMREFLNILDKCLREEANLGGELVAIPVPVLDGQSTKVILGDPLDKLAVTGDEEGWQPASHVSFTDEDARERRWFALENELLTAARGPPMIFKPNLQRLTSATPNSHPPTVPVRERVCVQVHLRNPLLVSLALTSIRPVYAFFDGSDEEVSGGGEDECVRVEVVSGFVMAPSSERVVVLSLWPQRPGRVVVRGIAYHIALAPGAEDQPRPLHGGVAVGVQQRIDLKGPRLNATLPEKTSVAYARDERLNVRVGPPMARLHAALRDPPGVLSCGELRCVQMVLSNVGAAPLVGLRVAVALPQNVFFSLSPADASAGDTNRVRHVQGTKRYDRVNRVQKVAVPNGALAVGEALRGHLWLHAPQSAGSFDVELLFFYQSEDTSNKSGYFLSFFE